MALFITKFLNLFTLPNKNILSDYLLFSFGQLPRFHSQKNILEKSSQTRYDQNQTLS